MKFSGIDETIRVTTINFNNNIQTTTTANELFLKGGWNPKTTRKINFKGGKWQQKRVTDWKGTQCIFDRKKDKSSRICVHLHWLVDSFDYSTVLFIFVISIKYEKRLSYIVCLWVYF